MDPLSFSRILPPQLIEALRVPEAPRAPAAAASSARASAPAAGAESGAAQPGSFAALLGEAVARVQQVESAADGEMQKLLRGEPVELHRVMLASEQAGLASELLMATRNKLVDAYQEVMRMQV